jgi:hypothetical protein
MGNYFNELVGVSAAQMPGTEKAFSRIIKEFDLIIELGTDNGGLSLWIYSNKKADTTFYTYELDPSHVQIPKEHEAYNSIKYCDCLSLETITSISDLIGSSGKALILCDGGFKDKEFEIYSKSLKSGDVIMLHDFADSPNEAENYKIIKDNCSSEGLWDGKGFDVHESSFESIKDHIIAAGLKKHNYEEFLNVLWGSFIKI